MRLQLFIIGVLLTQIGSSQQIDLAIEQNCKSSIMLDGKLLTNNATYDLPAIGSGLHFNMLKLPKNKNVIVHIQSQIQPVLDLVLDTNFFNITISFFTDKNLVTMIKNRRVNLSRDFTISIGCADVADGIVVCNFHPIRTNQPVTGAASPSSPGEGLIKNQTLESTENNTQQVNKEYHPGSAVIDALYLSKDPASIPLSDFHKILQFYYVDSFNADNILAMVASNKFLKEVFDEKYIQNLQQDNLAHASGSGIFSSLSLSSIGGLDVTNLADGLAKFLVKRAKEELSISFFKKFKETLDDQKDLNTLFPATTVVLGSISDEVYDYERYIQSLREAFKKDIQNLIENLPLLIPNHQAFFDNHKNLKASLNSGCYLVSQLQKQVHPGDILSNYPIEYLEEVDKDWKGSVQLLQLLSASLRDTVSTDSAYWVGIKYFRQLVASQKAFKIYIGLLYQMSLKDFDGVQFEKGKSFADFLNTTVDDNLRKYYQIKTFAMQFAEKADVLNSMIKSYEKPANDSLALELYKKYFDATIDLFNYSFRIGDLPVANNANFIAGLKDKLQPYFTIGNIVTDIIIDINRKNYSSAVNNTVELYSFIRIKPLESSNDGELKPAKTTFQQLVKYGNFMATVSTAKTSKEISEAIEAAALPTGSARIKRETPWNIALNAYIGPYLGYEKIEGVDSTGKWNSWGITAPIGISISRGHSLLFVIPTNWSFSSSLFLSVIDIGAVASFRFTNDSAAKAPTIELGDIVSPGIFYSLGIPKTPLSFNVGYQIGPLLRKVNLDKNEYSDKYSRWSVSLCVDIPLLNFYTKSR